MRRRAILTLKLAGLLAPMLLAAASCAAVSCAAKEGGPAAPPRAATEASVERDGGREALPSDERPRPDGGLPPPARDPVKSQLARTTGRAFAALDEGPYRLVVEGSDLRAASVAARTVRPVVTKLSKQFFDRGPRRGIRLVLFASDPTYRRGAEALTGERPDTPFGFYSHVTSAVIMNLGTGGGTLVHEMVHTFTETDFPGMPSWFDEGLASLYEQCRYAPGRLVGLTNWRLPDLQEKLREGEAGLLARVVATSTGEFYGPGSGLHYAAARYLCFDLQERGLLERFYRGFRKSCAKDPTGRKTLEKLLGEPLAAYEPGWIERTLKLRFPERRR